ncbi:MAG: Imm26 family immunity protein [Gammaproteobacteria bacterium]|jgi:hypothetical protein
MKYPFEPKSTTHLEPGQFWAIPLSNGSYACGVVLAKLISSGKIERRSFLAALIDWNGKDKPSSEDIKNKEIIKKGAAHIKTIQLTGGVIIGKTEFNSLPENPKEYTDDIVTMGYGVLEKVAEKNFVKNS